MVKALLLASAIALAPFTAQASDITATEFYNDISPIVGGHYCHNLSDSEARNGIDSLAKAAGVSYKVALSDIISITQDDMKEDKSMLCEFNTRSNSMEMLEVIQLRVMEANF
jgi:hypothetical protein